LHSNPLDYQLVAPASLQAVLETLASEPGHYTPIAGGTEIMVALGAGRLTKKNLVSINHLHELRFIDVTPDTIVLGSGTTFTDIRRNPTLQTDLPLLVQAASWTGSIANQNRGTLGGNIVNASPAADSPPALLAYDAELTLISSRGTRNVPYSTFHTGYKKTILATDELVHSITIQRSFAGYQSYTRKVGTRNAQAISKVAIAALALVAEGVVTDIRIGAASLRDRPSRLTATERALLHQPINAQTIAAARAALTAETQPIDDIRSTAKYRAAVAANLLEEFLRSV
jgi:CO/xanthine dehydrogenase FAD-binding subunit